MQHKTKHITVFEHQSLKVNQEINGIRFNNDMLEALQRYYGTGSPYFNLIHNGIQFNEHVGVIQVGDILIEVLPKADKNESDTNKWRDILIGMLRTVGSFDIKQTSTSDLKIKPNSVLDLYFEIFIKEVEYLIHCGLTKQYRKKEGNVTALKGSLQFGKQIQFNLTHKERFYVKHTTYDVEHKLHFILYKTIKLLKQINTNGALHSSIATLQLHFPEMPDIKVTEATFDKLVYNRKNQHYQKAIAIAKLILLHYHPDISRGRNNVLALMFDMNMLWEQFIYVSLRKEKECFTKVKAQTSKYFWKPENGRRTSMKPDIVIETKSHGNVVLDTKWKNLNGFNPSPDDLRQMYVYHKYFNAKKVALVYPGNKDNGKSGIYLNSNGEPGEKICSILLINVENDIKTWQIKIKDQVKSFVEEVK